MTDNIDESTNPNGYEVVDVSEAGIDSTIPAHAAEDDRDEFGAPHARKPGPRVRDGVRDTQSR